MKGTLLTHASDVPAQPDVVQVVLSCLHLLTKQNQAQSTVTKTTTTLGYRIIHFKLLRAWTKKRCNCKATKALDQSKSSNSNSNSSTSTNIITTTYILRFATQVEILLSRVNKKLDQSKSSYSRDRCSWNTICYTTVQYTLQNRLATCAPTKIAFTINKFTQKAPNSVTGCCVVRTKTN